MRDKLEEHNVFGLEPGRVIEGEDREVPNVITAGLNQLHGPLTDYNRMFAQLQRRRRMTPLSDVPPDVDAAECEERQVPDGHATATSSTVRQSCFPSTVC